MNIQDIEVNLRVYNRYADLFGRVTKKMDDDYVLVKYEWPYDPDALPCLVAISKLRSAIEMYGV